ncbi:MAG: OadG family protein [Blautia sp.]|nr:OadG family protein [Blautia sp.]
MDCGEVFFIYTINEETGKLTSMKAVEAEEVSAEAEGPAAGEAEGAAEEAQAAEAPQEAPAEEAAGNETIVLDAAEEEQAAAPEAEEAVRELSSEASSATIGEAEEAPVPEEETESVGSTFINAVLNTLMGICTVFIVLVFLSFIISQFKRIPGVDSRKRSAAPAPAAPISVLEPAEELVDDEELVAVITAAIMAANEGTAAEGDGFVVRSIRKSRRK